jgi:hypothetical protein
MGLFDREVSSFSKVFYDSILILSCCNHVVKSENKVINEKRLPFEEKLKI